MARRRPIHALLLAAAMGAAMWGVLAFGAVYPWAYKPLAAACAIVGVLALIVERRGRPPIVGLALALATVLAAIALQLVPLPRPTLLAISPGTDAFLAAYDFQYQLARAGDAAPSHPISIAPDKTLTGAALFTALSLFLLGLTRLLSAVGARAISRWIVAFGVLLAVIGIAQKGLTATDVRPLIYGFWRPRFEAFPFGPFVNPNHFGGWMLMGLPVALAAMLEVLPRVIDSAPPQRRWEMVNAPEFGTVLMFAAASIVMGLSLVMTHSRSALAAFAVGSLVLAVVIGRRQASRGIKLTVAAAALLVLAASAGWAGVDNLTSKFRDGQSSRSAVQRISAWTDTLSIIRDFPIAGSGFDTYGTAMMVYQQGDRRLHYQEAHNDYLQLAAEGGLLVGIPIVAVCVVFVRSVRQRFREAPHVGTTYYIRVGAVVGMLSVALQSMIEFSLQMPGNATFFAVLAAIALHQSPNLRGRSA